MRVYKSILLVFLILFSFAYGYAFSAYKIFPFDQLMQTKHYLEHKFGFFEEEESITAETVDIHETQLQRLLIKKIHIDSDIIHGGGMSNTDNTLYIATNKGKVLAFDLANFTPIELAINKVPLNYDQLIASGYPYETSFRFNWFRVNGVYAEKLENGMHHLYVSHQKYDAENECFRFTISRTSIDLNNGLEPEADSWNTFFAADPCINMIPEEYMTEYPPFVGNVSGGRMVYFDENHLLVSVGDYDRHALKEGIEEYAQDDSVPYGKFILIHKDTGEWSVYAKGTRNALGLFIDEEETIWSVENGPMGGDELNIIEKGNNYGWPRVSYGLWYNTEYHLNNDYKRGRHENYSEPIYSWIPSIAPNNLIKIEGDKFTNWHNDLIVSSMRDQSLHRLRLRSDNRVAYHERIEIGHRIRDITVLENESIALITDDGYLIIIEDGGFSYEEMGNQEMNQIQDLNQFDLFAGSAGVPENLTSGLIFEQKCLSCHTLDNTSKIGPHLNNLYSRTVGELENFNYSPVLSASNDSWSPELLREFLLNPDSEFRGTNMPAIQLSSSEIDSLIHYLDQQ